MPAPGEQHVNSLGRAVPNPFEEVRPHVSEYTAQEIATLQSRLEKQLGPEYISSRVGPSGQKVHYIAAEKCIQLANEIFGFNGWSSSIRELQVDFVDENPHTMKVSLGLSVIVRVSLRDGTFHEDIGYGHIENCKGKAAAFEKAKKEGTTDALKRALRNFGNVLGNCIYDRDYLAKVTKMKVAPTKWDGDGLHRHSDYSSAKKEIVPNTVQDEKQFVEVAPVPAESVEDEFGDFDEADFTVNHGQDAHPDEIVLSTTGPHQFDNGGNKNAPRATVPRNGAPSNSVGPTIRSQSMAAPPRQQNGFQSTTGSVNGNGVPTQQRPPQTPNAVPQKSLNVLNAGDPVNVSTEAVIASKPGQVLVPGLGRVLNQPSRTGPPSAPGSPSPPLRKSSVTDANDLTTDLPPPDGNATAGFLSAKALSKELHTGIAPLPASVSPAFNPHAESPSIRKTPGIDHNRSRPTSKDFKHVQGNVQPESAQSPLSRGNIVNPHMDVNRKLGVPPANASPLNNRASYKPPTMIGKRPNEGGNEPTRAPLGDIPANSTTPASELGNESKRQKLNGA